MQDNIFLLGLTFLYGISWLISMIAYFPTIKDLMKGIPSANFYTYALWFLYYLISVLYWIFILKDWLFIVVSGFDALFLLCIVILIIRIEKWQIIKKETFSVRNIKDKVVCHSRFSKKS